MKIMTICCLVLGVLLGTREVVANTGVRLSGCDSMAIAWSSEQAGADTHVEYCSSEEGAWLRLLSDVDAAGSATDYEMKDGSSFLKKAAFYRMSQCSSSTCESALMNWVPEFACPEERSEGYIDRVLTPLTVKNLDGSEYEASVNPSFTKRLKIIEYNMLRSRRDSLSMPRPLLPMLKPSKVNPYSASVDERVRFNVWFRHELERTGSRPNVARTGWEEIVKPAAERHAETPNAKVTFPRPEDWK